MENKPANSGVDPGGDGGARPPNISAASPPTFGVGRWCNIVSKQVPENFHYQEVPNGVKLALPFFDAFYIFVNFN